MTRRRTGTQHVLKEAGHDIAFGSVDGDGPALVMLHGLGARWQVYRPLMIRLQQHFTQIAPDLRGHGMSSWADAYRIQDFAADVVRLIERKTTPPVHVYGHSLGGWVALQVVNARPDLAHTLTIADSAVYVADLDPELVTSYLADLPVTLRSLAESLDQLDEEVMVQFRSGRMFAGYETDQLLRRVRCPTLLLQADSAKGGLMTDRDVARARDLLPNSTHIRMSGLGHALHVEDAVAVADAIVSFVQETDRTVGGQRS